MTSDRVRRLSTLLLAGVLAASALFTPASAGKAEAAGQPDLAIDYDMSQSVPRGQPFTFTVSMTNQGEVATANGQYYFFGAVLHYGHVISSYQINSSKFTCEIDNDIQSDEGPIAQIVCRSRYAFEPGEQVTLVVHAVARQRPGQSWLAGRVDLEDEPVPDSAWKNNTFQTTFQVS